jgi:ribosomal protein L3
MSKVQQLDKNLYGGMGADYWVVYTFGAKAGMMSVIMKRDEIISYSQVVGCIESDKAQLWGLGTSKKYQSMGYGTLMYKITKKFCKIFNKKKLEINVEPENISNKIYCKDEPEILAFGKFYPHESPRNILSVNLSQHISRDGTYHVVNVFDYNEMKKVISLKGKKYLKDWYVKNGNPFLGIMVAY